MDLHQKKLNDIKVKNCKAEVKKVEEILTRKNHEKQRNMEFVKQGKKIACSKTWVQEYNADNLL